MIRRRDFTRFLLAMLAHVARELVYELAGEYHSLLVHRIGLDLRRSTVVAFFAMTSSTSPTSDMMEI